MPLFVGDVSDLSQSIAIGNSCFQIERLALIEDIHFNLAMVSLMTQYVLQIGSDKTSNETF